MRDYAIVEAPSTLGLSGPGVEQLSGRLLEHGLAERIGARVAGAVLPPAASGRDPQTGILNTEELAAYAPQLANAVVAVLDAGEFPIVLGGDCTILVGSTLALRRRGRYGLLFLDGNTDFFQPEAEPNGEGASMELAWVTGHGPRIVTHHEGFHPLIRAEDVVAIGYRDHDDQAEYNGQPLPPELIAYDLPWIRRFNIERAVRKAILHLSQQPIDGYFIHLDADILDDAIMPAVDFRMPGGLSWDELATALRVALGSVGAIGLEVTIYNPRLDETGLAGRRLAELLVDTLAAARTGASGQRSPG